VERITSALVRPLALFLTCLAPCAGCAGDGGEPPETLVDGTEPPPLPAQLDLDDAVMTTARVLRGTAKLVEGCVTGVDAGVPGRMIERVGAVGRSLTFRDPDAPRLYACSASAGAREPRGEWCEAAVGRLRTGHLADARLQMANCVDRDG
jgi:hypothetical protein